MTISFSDVRYSSLTHEQIKDILRNIQELESKDLGITKYYLQNVSNLAHWLNEYKYDGELNFKDINEFLNPKENERPDGLEPRSGEVLSEANEIEPQRPDGLEPRSGEPEPEPEFFEERRGYDEAEDEMYNLIQARNAIDERIKELQQQEQQQEQDIDAIMNIPASDSPVARSHEERYLAYTAPNATGGILKGDIDRELNKELTKFIDKHPFSHIECDEALILFPPIDINKFQASLRRIGYTKNSIKKENHNVYIDYYLNKITELNFIFTSLDTIYEENKAQPFKIGFDCGFVVEDTKDVKYTRTAPNEDEIGRSIPVVIENQSDMNTYKHYVFSAISEKTERTHIDSAHRYCAIHTILFKITKLGLSGAKITVPGYDFLSRNKYIVVSPNEYNLCMFCSIYEALMRKNRP